MSCCINHAQQSTMHLVLPLPGTLTALTSITALTSTSGWILLLLPECRVYSPLELLLFIAGCCTIADSLYPQLINVPKATVTHVVRAVLSVSFVVGVSVVVYEPRDAVLQGAGMAGKEQHAPRAVSTVLCFMMPASGYIVHHLQRQTVPGWPWYCCSGGR